VQYRGHKNIINCLLDNGADVNKLNDEGVSALVISFFNLYPVNVFAADSASRPPSSHVPGYRPGLAVSVTGNSSTDQSVVELLINVSVWC